jgi:hypothetical protein
MSYCPTCGRQRSAGLRYCPGCGRDFGVAATGGAELTADHDVGPSRVDAAAEAPPTTVTMSLADRAAPPPPAPFRPVRPSRQSPWERLSGRRPLWIAVTVIVLLAAGGGAFAFVKATGSGPTALPHGHPSTVASSVTAPPTQPAATQPASLQASTSPAASPSPSASPSVSPSVVSVAPGAKPASAPVEIVLSHYFQGINKHDYAEYASSQTAQGKADQPQASFDSGYATTADSQMTLRSLTPTGAGDLTATVTFTSRQSPADSVDQSACNAWTLNLYLVPSGAGYLITPAPPNYEPGYTDC